MRTGPRGRSEAILTARARAGNARKYRSRLLGLRARWRRGEGGRREPDGAASPAGEAVITIDSRALRRR